MTDATQVIEKEQVNRVRFDTINVTVLETDEDIYVGAKNIVYYLNLQSPTNEYRKMNKLGIELKDFILPTEFGGRGKSQKFIKIGEVERYLKSFNTPHKRFKPPVGFVPLIHKMKDEFVQSIYNALDELTPIQPTLESDYEKTLKKIEQADKVFEEAEAPQETPVEEPEVPAVEEPEPAEESEPAEEDDTPEDTPEQREFKIRKRVRQLQLDMFAIEVQLTNALDELHQVADNLSSYKKRVRGLIRDIYETKTED